MRSYVTPPGGSGGLASASTFGVDNRIVRSDGTGRDLQVSLLGIDDSGDLIDSNGNKLLVFSVEADAVNHLVINNASAGDGLGISAVGPDSDIDLVMSAKGTGRVVISGLVITPSTGTLTIANLKTFTCSNTMTLVGADGSTYTLPPASASIGYLGMPQNSKSAAYTTVLADSGKHILHPTADNNARTFTIDSNANVAYPIGTAITFINQINTVTIAITADTMTLFAGAGTGTTGSRTLAAGGLATAVKVSSTGWIITGTGLT